MRELQAKKLKFSPMVSGIPSAKELQVGSEKLGGSKMGWTSSICVQSLAGIGGHTARGERNFFICFLSPSLKWACYIWPAERFSR